VHKRIYIITGKGGVGKTIFSLALTKHLLAKGQKVLYNHFDQDPPSSLCESLDIPILKLEEEESLKIYIGKKLHSMNLGSWVVKVPFFHSLFNIIPGLKNLVVLGHLIDKLKEDPELNIVVDSPSSGHVLTLFETTRNFEKIFKTGPLVDDIHKINKMTKNPEVLKTIILFLPTLMALNEGMELEKKISSLGYATPQLVMNNSFFLKLGEKKDLPEFLKKKLELEGQVINWYEDNLGGLNNSIPHIFEEKAKEIIEKVTPYMEGIL
jgi:arsenite-transporting ATPase